MAGGFRKKSLDHFHATFSATVENRQQRLFSIPDAAGYLRAIGAASVTLNFVRTLISSGQIPHIRIGRRFYVTRASLETWLSTHERR
jgi:excisionase family DNA binding protein